MAAAARGSSVAAVPRLAAPAAVAVGLLAAAELQKLPVAAVPWRLAARAAAAAWALGPAAACPAAAAVAALLQGPATNGGSSRAAPWAAELEAPARPLVAVLGAPKVGGWVAPLAVMLA